jgi:hypothetical protein
MMRVLMIKAIEITNCPITKTFLIMAPFEPDLSVPLRTEIGLNAERKNAG